MPAGLPPANLWKHRFFSPRSHEATKFPAQHLPAAVSSSQLRAFVVKKSGLTTRLTIPGKPESPGLFVAAYSPDCPGHGWSAVERLALASSDMVEVLEDWETRQAKAI
jgi:hypothetical protein